MLTLLTSPPINNLLWLTVYHNLSLKFTRNRSSITRKKYFKGQIMAEPNTQSKAMTDEERLQLAAKLDAELDEFINSLEKKRYSEGWPEDRWQEEMDKHPFFMKRTPQPGDEVPLELEGLQKLKYDPEENTQEELALNYKEDGNFYMKHKKFRMAVFSYTEGIKAKCSNPEVQAALYNNRSMAQFCLQNYRSALEDAQKAMKLEPSYKKAHVRAANCAFELNKYDLCAELCESLLEYDPENEQAKTLLKRNKDKKLKAERDKRKEGAIAKKSAAMFDLLCQALKDRQVEFDDMKDGQSITEELLRPKFLPLEDYRVHFDEENPTLLVWPAAFSYPEFLLSDFQQEIPENVTMEDCLDTLFKEPLSCDTQGLYRPDNVNVYYLNRQSGTVHRAFSKKTIKSIVQESRFLVTGGALLFYVVPKSSRIEKEFLNQNARPMIYT